MERPILFNSEMVRAILDGRKTQTRRPVEPQPCYNNGRYWKRSKKGSKQTAILVKEFTKDGDFIGEVDQHIVDLIPQLWKSPFGEPGDVLWVRETWFPVVNPTKSEPATYRADCSEISARIVGNGSGWRPSIHMPKWACRIKLRVKRVWVERVQNISEADAKAEGCECRSDLAWGQGGEGEEMAKWAVDHGHYFDFKNLWQSIYGNWKANPWVWCCEFERIES